MIKYLNEIQKVCIIIAAMAVTYWFFTDEELSIVVFIGAFITLFVFKSDDSNKIFLSFKRNLLELKTKLNSFSKSDRFTPIMLSVMVLIILALFNKPDEYSIRAQISDDIYNHWLPKFRLAKHPDKLSPSMKKILRNRVSKAISGVEVDNYIFFKLIKYWNPPRNRTLWDAIEDRNNRRNYTYIGFSFFGFFNYDDYLIHQKAQLHFKGKK